MRELICGIGNHHPESIQYTIDRNPPMQLCDDFDRFGVDQCLRKAGAGDEMLDAEGKEKLEDMYRRACWFIPDTIMVDDLVDGLEYWKRSACGRNLKEEEARVEKLLVAMKEVKQYLGEPK